MNDTKLGTGSSGAEEFSAADAGLADDSRVAEEAGAELQAEAANESGEAS
jgi:hypothetical protein